MVCKTPDESDVPFNVLYLLHLLLFIPLVLILLLFCPISVMLGSLCSSKTKRLLFFILLAANRSCLRRVSWRLTGILGFTKIHLHWHSWKFVFLFLLDFFRNLCLLYGTVYLLNFCGFFSCFSFLSLLFNLIYFLLCMFLFVFIILGLGFISKFHFLGWKTGLFFHNYWFLLFFRLNS